MIIPAHCFSSSRSCNVSSYLLQRLWTPTRRPTDVIRISPVQQKQERIAQLKMYALITVYPYPTASLSLSLPMSPSMLPVQDHHIFSHIGHQHLFLSPIPALSLTVNWYLFKAAATKRPTLFQSSYTTTFSFYNWITVRKLKTGAFFPNGNVVFDNVLTSK